MRYIGSKTSTVKEIHEIVSKYCKQGTFCDPFGGTATVSSFFKSKGYKVTTGDVLEFATCFQRAKLGYSRTPTFKKLKRYLNLSSNKELSSHFNSLISSRGWFIQEYSVKRFFFTLRNAQMIQSCWYAIIRYRKHKLVSEKEGSFLLASLINSMDRVANTAGTYYAFLKSLDRKAKNSFAFEFIKPTKGRYNGITYKCDALQLLQRKKFDIVYLDPPYNSRNYLAYYHLPETIASCTIPKIFGIAGVPKRIVNLESNFYSSALALKSLEDIINSGNFKFLVFHYRDDGIITPKELNKLFKKFNCRGDFNIDSLGYTTAKSRKRTSGNHIYVLENV